MVQTEAAPVDDAIPSSQVVVRYLASKQINDRTDDDKTLILASRRRTGSGDSADVDADQSATCPV
jgi:hypothetical protein